MLCTNCRCRDALPSKSTCQFCRDKSDKSRAERIARGGCRNCANPAEEGQKRCASCIEKDRRRNHLWKLNLKREVMAHYGGAVCRCCGESTLEFLTIDHIDGGGRQHREQIGHGKTIYSWLKKNDYPEGYQTLCYNCNCAKGFYGICPHEKARREKAEAASRRDS